MPSPDTMLPAAAQTWRRIAVIIALSILLFQFIPGQHEAGTVISTMERFSVAGAWAVFAGAVTLSAAFRRRALVVFELLLYVTGLWAVRILAADAFSPGSVLTLVMATFGLGLGFRDADRLARFYLTVLAAIAALYVFGDVPERTDPTLVLAVLGAIMTVAYLVARTCDDALTEASVLALVASHVHNGVVMTDPAGRVVWINDGFTRMTGLSLGPLVGRALLDTLPSPPTPVSERERLRQALTLGNPVTVEAARVRPDGTVLWIALDLTPVRDATGAIERFIAIETDVSAAHAYVSEIQDAMSDLLFVVLPDGTIRSANREACARLGVGPDELVGASLATFITPLPDADTESEPERTALEADPAFAPLRAYFSDPDARLPPGGVEVGLRGRNGGVVAVHATASDLPAVGDLPRRVVIVARDITEQRRLQGERAALEKKVRQAQKLESLGVLAGGIAHDFNNLLVGVLGNASLLREEVPPDPKLAGLVDRIEESAQRAADLTRQMLAYSGRGRFVIELMDLSSVADEMRRLVAAAMSKRATLKLELARNLPSVEGDVTQVRQVVMNLLTNASDALDGRDGTITLRTAVVDADRSLLASGVLDDDLPPGPYVVVEVEDTGAGMSEAVRRRMFEPFFTTKATGRGLGLAATLGIVRGHRGAIRVRSEPGRGTVVSVYLPSSNRGRVATPMRPPLGRVELPKARVLVADDEPAVLDFVAQVLRTTGAEVVTASDGRECVERFQADPGGFNLVILDLTMPRMNGDEAFVELRRLRPDLPVLLSSGYSEQEATSRFAGVGLAGFLQKPYRARQLLAQIKPLLGAAGEPAGPVTERSPRS